MLPPLPSRFVSEFARLATTRLQYLVIAPCVGPEDRLAVAAMTGIFNDRLPLHEQGTVNMCTRLHKVSFSTVKVRVPTLPRVVLLAAPTNLSLAVVTRPPAR